MDKFRFLSNPVESILQCQHTVITSPLSIRKELLIYLSSQKPCKTPGSNCFYWNFSARFQCSLIIKYDISDEQILILLFQWHNMAEKGHFTAIQNSKDVLILLITYIHPVEEGETVASSTQHNHPIPSIKLLWYQ